MCLIKYIARIKADNAEREYYRKMWEETPHFDVSFHRKDGKWYIDLPGVAEEKCRLIGGSEIFIDKYADFVNYDDDDDHKPDKVTQVSQVIYAAVPARLSWPKAYFTA